jgi:hypothetical protein
MFPLKKQESNKRVKFAGSACTTRKSLRPLFAFYARVSDMNTATQILVLTLAAGIGTASSAEPGCEFRDPSHRRISGDNPDDFLCIQIRARAGDDHWQYYLGLILIGGVPGPVNVPEGLAVLKKVALRNNTYSADAMRFIGYVYKEPDSAFKNYELAYQWLYLASQQQQTPGSTFPLPDEELSLVISPQRMKELERDAHRLVQNR